MTSYTWLSASRTDPGLVRKENEDAVLERPEAELWAVADGMGGHTAGHVASRAIVDRLAELPANPVLSRFVTDVETALLGVNVHLRNLGKTSVSSTIGSTVVALMLHGNHGVCMWAGDSRAYRLRDGELIQLTQDHALVEELIESGYLDRDQASLHPQANLITRAVGAHETLKLDLEIFELHDGDMFILCSDGLDKEVSKADIAEVANECLRGRIAAPAAEALVGLALARGARDNVTVSSVTIHNEPVSSGDDFLG